MSKITLNTLDLELDDITIQPGAGKESLRASKREFDPVEQRAIFTFPELLAARSNARLTITFSGELQGNLCGYYRSVDGKDGETVHSLTQFQPTAARRAFPCWDEPTWKATFAITLISRLLDRREAFVPLDTTRPFKLNAFTTGFYVMQYSAERLVTLGQQAASPNLPFTLQDRIGLAARGGGMHVPYDWAVRRLYADEPRADLVWDATAGSLSAIVSTWWEHPKVAGLLDAFRRPVRPAREEAGGVEPSPSDTTEQQLPRTVVVENGADAGDPWVAQELKTRFDRFREFDDHSAIPGDLTAGVQEGGRAEWEFAKCCSADSTDPTRALAATTAPGATLAEETFRHALTEGRDQDVLYCLRGLQRNAATRRFLADKAIRHFPEFERRYAGTSTLNRWLDVSFGALSSEGEYQRVSSFFKNKDTAAFELALRQTLDTIRARPQWTERSTGELTQWLEGHKA
ncbi:hypothetical protein BD413DRAFT_614231 [Trametes elegans]|nr:hypothetical protein BD413DRAFT_614231 [Trametes elegans]